MLKPRFVESIALVGMMVLNPGLTWGQNFPNKPIRILASEAGSSLEAEARIIAGEISGPLGQPVIVENRPSALLADMLARATPDGYTLALAAGVFWLTPLVQKTTYDPVKDFSPITLVETYPHVLVMHPSVPVRTIKELIDLAKAKPGVLNISAAASPGGQSFLSAELFKSMAGVNIVRIPYKGNAQALVALLANEVQLMFNNYSSVIAHVKSGKLRALAVTSLKPFALAPDLPTLSASGLPGYESILIAGILAPARTPGVIVNQLNKEIVLVLDKADVKEKFLNDGVEGLGSSPGEFSTRIKTEIVKWGKVLKDAGVKPEL